MEHWDSVVIGAGHAGLAMSKVLTARGIEHLVLDRRHVGASWEHERWDSFTLLTPNWATWLPGWHYTGPDPHGFMGRAEVVTYLRDYAASFDAPVRAGTDVVRLDADRDGPLTLTTDSGRLSARTVVVATGPFQEPKLPPWAAALPPGVTQLHSRDYKSPDQLPPGAVLVVGAGPSGHQIADDLARGGRRVHLCVGRHRRVPRRYRGRDYYWWQELGGFYEKTAEDVPPAVRRSGVAPVLTGFQGGQDLDLRELAMRGGVQLLGRAVGTDGPVLELDDSLAATLREGDRAYSEFTGWVEDRLYRFDGLFDHATPRETFPEPPAPPASLDLSAAEVSTVVFATGFRSRLVEWMQAPVFGRDGLPVHERGATAVPGLFVLGQRWLHRLRSPFIRGAEEDATHLGAVVANRLAAG